MYIDPNTGGILFQALAIAFTAVSGVVLVFSGRIKMMVAKWRRKRREEAEQNHEVEE